MFTIVQRRKIWFLVSLIIIVPGIIAGFALAPERGLP